MRRDPLPRYSLVLCFVAALLSCSPSRPQGADTAGRTTTKASSAEQPTPSALPSGPRYILLHNAKRISGPPLIPRALVNGVRFTMHEGRLVSAEDGSDPALSGAFEVPTQHGAGFLFHNDRGLYRAPSYVGELTPFADVSSTPFRVSFGPGFLLVDTQQGKLVLDAKTGQRRPLPVAGLDEIAMLPDGQALALTVTGAALTSGDGTHWTDLSDRLPSPATGISERDSAVFWTLLSGQVATLAAQGQVRLLESLPGPPAESGALFRRNHRAYFEAVERGIFTANSHAIAPVDGAIATVDLISGVVETVGSALLPRSSERCQLLEHEPLPLLLCRGGSALSVIVDPLGSTREERTFPIETRVSYAASTLVLDGACDGTRAQGQVCVRSATGDYQSYDRSKEVTAAAATKPGEDPSVQLEWVPKAGGALGLLLNPTLALIDAQTGTTTRVSPEHEAALRNVLSTALEDLVEQSRIASPDEHTLLRGYSSSSSFAALNDGRIAPNPHQFSSVVSAGARALGVDSLTRVFESLDYGASWHEVAAPPLGGNPSRCSSVGCRGPSWLRLGWGPAAPEERPALRVVPQVHLLPRSLLPTLSCRELGAPEPKEELPSEQSEVPIVNDLGLGARRLLLQSGEVTFFREFAWLFPESQRSLMAVVHARTPLFGQGPDGGPLMMQSELNRSKSIAFTRVFDPSGEVQNGSLSWRAQLQAANRVAGEPPDFQAYDQTDIELVPVLAELPQLSDGLLLREGGALIWISDRGRTEALSLGVDGSSAQLLAAVARKGELSVLVSHSDYGGRIVRLGGPRLETVSSVQGMPTALAVATDGTLSPFFNPVGIDPPSTQDPAMIRRGRELHRLPAWSTLRLASDPECAPSADDQRVLVRADHSWLALDMPSLGPQTSAESTPMLAIVRVNPRRFCLEAVELGIPAIEWSNSSVPLRVIMTTGAKAAAAKVGFALGAEYRQALSCTLQPR